MRPSRLPPCTRTFLPARLTASLALLYQPLVVRPAAAWSRGVTPQSGPPRRHQVPLLAMLHLAIQQKVQSFGQNHSPINRRLQQALCNVPRCYLEPWEVTPLLSEGQKSTTPTWRPAQPRQGRAARRQTLPLLAANLGGMARDRLPLHVASPACVLQYFSWVANTASCSTRSP